MSGSEDIPTNPRPSAGREPSGEHPGVAVRPSTDELALEPSTSPKAPLVAGRYVVDKLIARGGMAAVFLAEHVELQRRLALKILKPPPEADEAIDFEERFRLEARTLAQLAHPNIVTLHDFGRMEDGRYFLAMEYVEGPRFADLLRQGPMEPERVIRLLLQVCQALHYAHQRGVIHRDLKPSNLLIRQYGDGQEVVKVVDFGLVKLAHDDQTLTNPGLVLGSPHCMSPEQVRGNDVDARTDVYAIGILLFRAVMGRYPFHGRNSTATMLAHLNEAPPTFFSVQPDFVMPEGLEDVVRRCLAKDPTERFDDMGALITALADVIDAPADAWLTGAVAASTIKRKGPVVQPTGAHQIVGAAGIGALGGVALMGLLLAIVWWGMGGLDPTSASATAAPSPSQPAATAPGSADPAPPAATPAPPSAAEAAPAPAAPPPAAAPEPEPEPRRTSRPRSSSSRSSRPAPARATPDPKPAAPAPKPADPPPTKPDPSPEPEGYRGLPDDF